MREQEIAERAAKDCAKMTRQGWSSSHYESLFRTIILAALNEAAQPQKEPPMEGTALIAHERLRQVMQEGRHAAHDDLHTDGVLAIVAASLAVDGTAAEVHDPDGRGTDFADSPGDCWGLVRKHRSNRVRQLTIAGALIAAEIDRLQRSPPAPPAEPAYVPKVGEWFWSRGVKTGEWNGPFRCAGADGEMVSIFEGELQAMGFEVDCYRFAKAEVTPPPSIGGAK